MATLCSLGALCRCTILKPLIQHSVGLNAALLQGQSWHCSCSSQALFLPQRAFSNMPFPLYFPTDSWQNWHFGFFFFFWMVNTCCNDLFALAHGIWFKKPESFRARLSYVCAVYSTRRMFVVRHSHSVHACVPVGVVSVLFDSLCPALISALVSPVLSWLHSAVQA